MKPSKKERPDLWVAHVQATWSQGDGWGGDGGGITPEVKLEGHGPLTIMPESCWVALRRSRSGATFPLIHTLRRTRAAMIRAWNEDWDLEYAPQMEWSRARRRGEVRAVRIRALVVEE